MFNGKRCPFIVTPDAFIFKSLLFFKAETWKLERWKMFHINPGQVKLSGRFTTEDEINCFANFPHKKKNLS